jgi:hypothetical protein
MNTEVTPTVPTDSPAGTTGTSLAGVSVPPAPAPTVGRVVHVQMAIADGALVPKPMIITDVHGPTSVSGVVFDAFNGGAQTLTGVLQGTGEKQWSWPPRA